MLYLSTNGMLLYLSFQKGFVFIGGGAADVAQVCQFADVQLPVFVGGIVAEEGGGDVLFAYLRISDLPPLRSESKIPFTVSLLLSMPKEWIYWVKSRI